MEEQKKYTGYGYHGGGRPKTGNTYKKFSVACTHAEYEQIKKAAEVAGKSISRVLVDAVLDQAENKVKAKKFYVDVYMTKMNTKQKLGTISSEGRIYNNPDSPMLFDSEEDADLYVNKNPIDYNTISMGIVYSYKVLPVI